MRLLISVGICLACLTSFSQSIDGSVPLTATHHVQTESYSVDWMLGELIVQPIHSVNYLTTGLMGSDIKFIVTSNDVNFDDQSINAYPNPFSASFGVFADGEDVSNLEIAMTDAMGRTVSMHSEKSNHSVKFYTQHLSAGVYFLQVKDVEKSKTAFIKLVRE